MIIIDTIDEAVLTAIITLRQNIYTDPEKPLQVESKIYYFNRRLGSKSIFSNTKHYRSGSFSLHES